MPPSWARGDGGSTASECTGCTPRVLCRVSERRLNQVWETPEGRSSMIGPSAVPVRVKVLLQGEHPPRLGKDR